MIDDVIVGHRIAVGDDEEAGAFAGDGLMVLRLALSAIAALMAELLAELLEELVERRTGLCRNLLLVVVVPSVSCIIAGSADAGILTRTEITAGFTLVTRSAKPVGCCGARIGRRRAGGVPNDDGNNRSVRQATAPRQLPATEAKSVTRRAK